MATLSRMRSQVTGGVCAVEAVCARISDLAGAIGWQVLELEAHLARQGEGYCQASCGCPRLRSVQSAMKEPVAV